MLAHLKAGERDGCHYQAETKKQQIRTYVHICMYAENELGKLK